MNFDSLVWGEPTWAWPAVAIAVVLTVLVLLNYARSDAPHWVRVLSTLLKLAAIVLLAVCLVEPMRRGTRPRPQANLLPILVDSSQSMQVKSPGESTSRFDDVMGHLDDEALWLSRVSQSFDVRRYRFDRRLENVTDFESIKADGNASSIATALRSVGERFEGRPIGGVMLFSDGNLTDGDSIVAKDWAELGFPVFPVVSNRVSNLKDLRIVDVSVRQTDFESAPTTVVVRVDAVGFKNQKASVVLTDANGTLVEEQSIAVGGDNESAQVEARFRFRPEKSGVTFYTATVSIESDREAMKERDLTAAVSKSGESTLVNNRRVVTIDRDSGPYRVLYVAGRPNWEFKFLRRALEADAEIQLVGLLRIADKEPKFSFRDRGVSGTNPLFAGLGKDEEEIASQYDEPVILRFGVKESEELSDGFPKSDEELFAYHAVILDDLEPSFFTQDQMLRLRRFVAARGGGLMLLGGQESFAADSFADSALEELSPVYAARGSARTASTDPPSGKVALTREGMLQPWIRLRDTEDAEAIRLRQMPSFLTINAVGDVKPGASSLATLQSSPNQTDRSSKTAIATQRFGKGRTAAVAVGDLWRWSMRREAGERSFERGRGTLTAAKSNDRDDPGQMWRQMMHWLVGEVPQRVKLSVDPTSDPNGSTSITVDVRDEAFLPLDNASVEIVVNPVGGEEMKLTAEPDRSVAGLYRADFWPRRAGGHAVSVVVKAADGSDVGTDASGWTSEIGSAEYSSLQLNRELLEAIADQTGGKVIDQEALEAFADDLPNRKVPVTENWVYPLWHRGWVMMAVMACLCGEWGLRRWKGQA
ncbi:hypothetical protein Poly51_47210 [Rubripirellula tenax]|uniref:Glutamine amidotransferase domain-containing protein n=1 Tax=Rubripirellula tenax TaxID=2528015 RepID=A0A5C6EL25_9BACT|nr:hypothetical protein [Rubripirellula tenax]TWU48817.1 hypothetical protein Poly51_47210 [Rubripirellula tenax]